MAERDPLRERFDAFRDESVRTARPPGPESIPGVLRRRRRRNWAAAAAAAVVAVLALTVLPRLGSAPHPPDPAISESAPPIATTEAVPSSAPPGSGSPSVQAGGPGGSASAKPAFCTPTADGTPTSNGPYLSGNDVFNGGTWTVTPANFFDQCPAFKVHFVEAHYGWSNSAQQIVLISSVEHTLTRATPVIPAPAYTEPPNGACGSGYIALQTTKPIPTSIPNAVQDTDGGPLQYVQRHATGYPVFWSFLTATQARGIYACGGKPSSIPTIPSPQ
jgi:hypothetical protein